MLDVAKSDAAGITPEAQQQTGSDFKPRCDKNSDRNADVKFLCFANMRPPYPEPWVESFNLLKQAFQPAVSSLGADSATAQCFNSLDLDWYVGVLSRLHLNSFRVETVPLVTGFTDLRGGQGFADSRVGSAAYLLASLFNHSCDPNVNVTWPYGNGTAVFRAARDIDAGEQLTITYIDAESAVSERRQQLLWAYGFKCMCARCCEEEP